VTDRILIKDAIVLSQDEAIGELPQADILVEGDRIAQVGPNLSAEGAQVVDAAGDIASAVTGEGIDEVRAALGELLPDAAALAEPPEPAGVVVHRIEALGDGFAVERHRDAFVVRGKRIERIAAQTNFDNDESAARFQHDLARLGIDADMDLGVAFNKLVGYFRDFTAKPLPRSTGDIYRDLCDSQKGVCRHRAFAFMITANAIGIPTRFIENEAHAFVEVWFPGRGWQRIDLGGAALRMDVQGADNKTLHRPRADDPFEKPRAYKQSYTQLEGDIQGLTRQQLADKHRSLNQAPPSGAFDPGLGGGSGSGAGSSDASAVSISSPMRFNTVSSSSSSIGYRMVACSRNGASLPFSRRSRAGSMTSTRRVLGQRVATWLSSSRPEPSESRSLAMTTSNGLARIRSMHVTLLVAVSTSNQRATVSSISDS